MNEYVLIVVVPLLADFYVTSEKVEAAVGKMRDGSGGGFDERDMDWSFETRDEAEAAMSRVVALKIPKLFAEVLELDDDHEME